MGLIVFSRRLRARLREGSTEVPKTVPPAVAAPVLEVASTSAPTGVHGVEWNTDRAAAMRCVCFVNPASRHGGLFRILTPRSHGGCFVSRPRPVFMGVEFEYRLRGRHEVCLFRESRPTASSHGVVSRTRLAPVAAERSRARARSRRKSPPSRGFDRPTAARPPSTPSPSPHARPRDGAEKSPCSPMLASRHRGGVAPPSQNLKAPLAPILRRLSSISGL
jgi:hypothetical protein